MFFQPSRDEARLFFVGVWKKALNLANHPMPLSPAEQVALAVILEHPEYQGELEREEVIERRFFTGDGETNFFLHLALHLALEEQLSIDQPPSITARYRALLESGMEGHDAKHLLMECLAETIWQAQQEPGKPLDGNLYLALVDTRSKERHHAG